MLNSLDCSASVALELFTLCCHPVAITQAMSDFVIRFSPYAGVQFTLSCNRLWSMCSSCNINPVSAVSASYCHCAVAFVRLTST